MAVKDQVITEDYAMYCGDAIEVMQTIPDDSIHLTVYSPPFGGLYQYSSDERDLSNADSYEDFFKHYRFVVKEKTRITMPGRMSVVHCSDIPQSNTGRGDELTDLPGDIIKLHQEEGWQYNGRHCIWKEPLGVRNRTMAKRLAHKTIVEDATKSGPAGADYLLVFRKRGENPVPVTHKNGIMNYAGSQKIPENLIQYRGWAGKQIENKFSHWIWQRYASSFWTDIREENILPYKGGKDSEDEKHVHPLQLDVIDRACELYSNIGEKVLTPFAGVFSEVYGAVSYGRKGIGIELKESYFNQGIKNMKTVKNRFKDTQLKAF